MDDLFTAFMDFTWSFLLSIEGELYGSYQNLERDWMHIDSAGSATKGSQSLLVEPAANVWHSVGVEIEAIGNGNELSRRAE